MFFIYNDMITKFKLFEDSDKKLVWNIPVKMPDFYISLKKIGMPDKQIIDWIRLRKNKVFSTKDTNTNFETISLVKDSEQEDSYTWYWYPTSESNEYNIFMGKLECTPEEIQEYYDDIEFKKNTTKFNI